MFSNCVKRNELYFRKIFKSGKMDSYAGSEPREFIPFYLEKEPNGQPNQTATASNNMSSGTGITEDVATNETLGQ